MTGEGALPDFSVPNPGVTAAKGQFKTGGPYWI
jgi:hypothetical protein